MSCTKIKTLYLYFIDIYFCRFGRLYQNMTHPCHQIMNTHKKNVFGFPHLVSHKYLFHSCLYCQGKTPLCDVTRGTDGSPRCCCLASCLLSHSSTQQTVGSTNDNQTFSATVQAVRVVIDRVARLPSPPREVASFAAFASLHGPVPARSVFLLPRMLLFSPLTDSE